jgi:hypothetical protein
LVPAAVTVKVAFCDGATIRDCGCAVMVGPELTLIDTVALPFAQLPSETTALNVVELVTFTVRDDEGDVMPLCVTPSDQRTVHGPVVVNVKGIVTDDTPHATSIEEGRVSVGSCVMITSALVLAVQPLTATVTER